MEHSDKYSIRSFRERLRRSMRRHALLSFFLLAFCVAWGYGLPAFGLFHLQSLVWALPLALSSTLAALIMSWAIDGKSGVYALLRRSLLWHVGVKWYLFVLLALPALILLGILLIPGAGADFRFDNGIPLLYLITLVPTLLVGGPLFEEPGWRGFALPRLQRRMGPVYGTLVLGILWGLWHLPLFLIPGYNGTDANIADNMLLFATCMIQTYAFSVIFAWIYNCTHGSLLLTILAHTSINMEGVLVSLFPALTTTALDIAVTISETTIFTIFAIILLLATRGRLGYIPVASCVQETVSDRVPLAETKMPR
jgi:CAAX amino terminal protease family.